MRWVAPAAKPHAATALKFHLHEYVFAVELGSDLGPRKWPPRLES